MRARLTWSALHHSLQPGTVTEVGAWSGKPEQLFGWYSGVAGGDSRARKVHENQFCAMQLDWASVDR